MTTIQARNRGKRDARHGRALVPNPFRGALGLAYEAGWTEGQKAPLGRGTKTIYTETPLITRKTPRSRPAHQRLDDSGSCVPVVPDNIPDSSLFSIWDRIPVRKYRGPRSSKFDFRV